MRFLDRIRKVLQWTGSDRELSDRIDKTEMDLFTSVPWSLNISEENQNDLIEFLLMRDI